MLHGACLAYRYARYRQSVSQNGDSAGAGSVHFMASGVTNRQNCRIWGNKNPCVTCELEGGTPKVTMWASLMHNMVIGSFFFLAQTITGISYLDMLENFAFPQLAHQAILWQDGAL